MEQEGAAPSSDSGMGSSVSPGENMSSNASTLAPGSVSGFSDHSQSTVTGNPGMMQGNNYTGQTLLQGNNNMSDSGVFSGRTSTRDSNTTTGTGDSGVFTGRNSTRDSNNSSNFTNRTGDSGLGASLPTEKVNVAERTSQWADEQYYEVFVRNINGKTHTLTVCENDTVENFREQVAQCTGVPESQQWRLTTQNGRHLENGRRLKDYHIEKHQTIYCQGRLRGGQ